MTGLETTYAVLNTLLPGIPQVRWTELFSVNPRRLFGLPDATIREGNEATITFFDPEKKWTYSKNDIRSKSANTPFIGKEFRGKPVGIINRGNIHFNGNDLI
jgi:dihydroorotase